jgi:hypothetical protein
LSSLSRRFLSTGKTLGRSPNADALAYTIERFVESRLGQRFR